MRLTIIFSLSEIDFMVLIRIKIVKAVGNSHIKICRANKVINSQIPKSIQVRTKSTHSSINVTAHTAIKGINNNTRRSIMLDVQSITALNKSPVKNKNLILPGNPLTQTMNFS